MKIELTAEQVKKIALLKKKMQEPKISSSTKKAIASYHR